MLLAIGWLWLALFLVGGVVQVFRHGFTVGDGHPMLPPLVAPVLCLGTTLAEPVLPVGADPWSGPSLAVNLAGTGALVLLGRWEHRTATEAYGGTLRGGPPDVARDPETGARYWVAPGPPTR